VLLWALTDDSRHSAAPRERLSDVTTTTYVSAVLAYGAECGLIVEGAGGLGFG